MNGLLYAATVLIWGTTWLAIKFQLGVVAAPVSVAWRFTMAAAMLLIWCVARRERLRFSLRDHGFMALQGVCLFSLNYLLIYLAEQRLASGVVALAFSAIVFLNIINGAIFLGRRLAPRVIAGSAIGLAGLAATFWPDLVAFDPKAAGSIGLVFCLVGALSASFGNIVSIRNGNAGVPILQANAFGMAYGAIAMLLASAALGVPFAFELSVGYVGSLIYLALFGSVLAFGCYLTLAARIGPERAAYSSMLFPIVALGLSTWFEGYVWTPRAVVGVALILLGNAVILVRLPQRRAVAAPAQP